MFTVVVPDDEDRGARAANVLLEDDNGTIWCGTMKHLYQLDRQGDRFKLTPVDVGAKELFVLDMLEDRHRYRHYSSADQPLQGPLRESEHDLYRGLRGR